MLHVMATPASAVTREEAYQLGRDYVIHGANHENCHFSIFCDPQSTAAWEEGRMDAERKAWSVSEAPRIEAPLQLPENSFNRNNLAAWDGVSREAVLLPIITH